MYSSGYSQVSRHSPQTQKRMQYRSKGKSCGYYLQIIFFFSSLIQALIIVSLVLFLVYGKDQDSAAAARIQDLEEHFSQLSIENVNLRQQRKNLTNLLNATLTDKARNDWDLLKLRHYANLSVIIIQDYDSKVQHCNAELFMCRASGQSGCKPISTLPHNCNCGIVTEQMRARLDLVNTNFTQTVKVMRGDMEQIAKERDYINLEAIRLRREKATQEKELEFFKRRCENDFSQSLSGVSNVSKAFLHKIESLFPSHIAFQLTCPKQREHLEQIRANCTNLSREVENKLQQYLNTVGQKVSEIQAENSHMKAENLLLSEDYRRCTQNRSGLIQEHKQTFEKLQRKHDQDKEKLLVEKMRLIGDKEVLEQSVRYKSKEVEHLTLQIRHLNMTCATKLGFGGGLTNRLGTSSQTGFNIPNIGGSSSASSSSTGGGQFSRTALTGLGSSFNPLGSQLNKPGLTGTGASSSSSMSIGSKLGHSPSLSLNKFGSTGTGVSSSSSTLGGSNLGHNPSLSVNKFGSTGTGASSSSSTLGGSNLGHNPSLSVNKFGSTGTGASSSSSTLGGSNLGHNPSLSLNKFGSTGTDSLSSSLGGSGVNKPGSTGGAMSNYGLTGLKSGIGSSGVSANKPAVSTRGSSTPGLSSAGSSLNPGSSGIGSNKPTTGAKNSGFGSWFGVGNSNSGSSKPGSATGKGPSTGNSGTGSAFGRTSGLSSVNVAQHIQDLQRIINPPGPQEKNDLSRMLG
ncbi:plasmalemma vesicle associated protein a isoform X1 [Echeneis naucrates]|uniref:Uncharacterized LOC115057812 n=1 Tax=Echeneis naucrates TaxID=173247 RepID=A0A665USS0_ECHNA|nr:uncharacterized protein LOC115057812 isoform X1 [Echeneis naucrates]